MKEFQFTFSESAVKTIRVNQFFELSDPEKCPIEDCELLAEDCIEMLESAVVSKSMTEASGTKSIFLEAQRGVIAGYTAKFCL